MGEGSPSRSQHMGLGIQHDFLSPHPVNALDGRPSSVKHSHSPSGSRPHSPHLRGHSSGYASPSRYSPGSPRGHTPHSRGSPRPLSRSKYKRHGSDIGVGDDEDEGDSLHGAGSPSRSSSSSSSSRSHSSPSSASDPDLDAIQRSLWKPHLVELASPFVLVSGKRRVEAGIFFGFDRLMSLIESHRAQYPLAHQLASFHSLLRRTLPDLRSYFDDEGLDVTPFVKGWLESLFSGQMKLTDSGCLRLWGKSDQSWVKCFVQRSLTSHLAPHRRLLFHSSTLLLLSILDCVSPPTQHPRIRLPRDPSRLQRHARRTRQIRMPIISAHSPRLASGANLK